MVVMFHNSHGTVRCNINVEVEHTPLHSSLACDARSVNSVSHSLLESLKKNLRPGPETTSSPANVLIRQSGDSKLFRGYRVVCGL